MTSLLTLTDLAVSVQDKQVVHGVSLDIQPGEIHAIMGPNGSGKSSLVHALMGHPAYQITGGSAAFLGEDLLLLAPYERARKGLFLAFQYPKDIAGVSLRNFLFAAYNAQMSVRSPKGKLVSPIKFKIFLTEKMQSLTMDPVFAERHVNKGFSGGEKKKAEVLQMSVLEPVLALLDETDSGLDVDALRVVADGVNAMRSPKRSMIIVTHYARVLDLIQPDYVHVMVGGNIVASGGKEFAAELEQSGYKKYGIDV